MLVVVVEDCVDAVVTVVAGEVGDAVVACVVTTLGDDIDVGLRVWAGVDDVPMGDTQEARESTANISAAMMTRCIRTLLPITSTDSSYW